MFRFLGLADDEPKQSTSRRPKSRKELEAARRAAIAREIHAEERRAEFEEIVDRCCPEHVLTTRHYFDSETLDWKVANNPTGVSLINQFHLCSLRNSFSTWDNVKSYFKSFLTGEKELDPKEVKMREWQERLAERRRRGLHIMTGSTEFGYVSDPEVAENLWQEDDDDSEGLLVVPSAEEIEARWRRLMEMEKQAKIQETEEEKLDEEKLDDAANSNNVEDIVEHVEATVEHVEATVENVEAIVEDDESHIEFVCSAFSVPNSFRYFPDDNSKSGPRIYPEEVHESLNKPNDPLTILRFNRPSIGTDYETKWALDTFGSSEATSKATARPKSDYLDSEIESEQKVLKTYKITIEQIREQERIVRCNRVIAWLSRPPFTYRWSELKHYSASTEFTVGAIERPSSTFALDLKSLADSYISTVSAASSRRVRDWCYRADISDLAQHYQSYMVKKRGYQLPYYMLDFDGVKLFSDPIVGRAEVFPADQPIFTEYKGGFCESRTTASMSNCDLTRFYPVMPGPRWHARVYGKRPLTRRMVNRYRFH